EIRRRAPRPRSSPPLPPGKQEIEEPEDAGSAADRKAEIGFLHELAEAALEDRRNEEEQHGAEHDLPRPAAMKRQAFEPGVAARKEQRLGDHQPARAAEQDGGELGRAVNGEPAEELDGEAAIGMEREEGAQGHALIEQQQ